MGLRFPEEFRLQVGFQVKRVFGAAGFSFAEAVDWAVEDFADSLLAILGAVSSPGSDDQADF